MRNAFRLLGVAALTGFSLLGMSSCGDDYDDSEIRDRLEQVEDRVAKLEEWCNTANGEIEALQGLVAALESNDYVTGVETLTDGYRISFSKSESIIIRNGKDGADGLDGYTPVIGAARHSDGLHYWTIQTEEGKTVWLTDTEGNMIRTTGDNGKDGADGLTPHIGENGNWWIGETDTEIKAQGDAGSDGLTPHIGNDGNWWIGETNTGVPAKGINGNDGKDAPIPQVKTGKELGGDYIADAVYLSVDGGKIWTKISGDKGAQGDKGDSMFESVTPNPEDGYLEVKLASDGTTIKLPYYSSALRFENYETTDVYTSGTLIKVILPDNLTENNYDLLIATAAPISGATTRAGNGWTVSIDRPNFGSAPATAIVTVKSDDNILDVGDQALLSVILTYKDGTQTTVSKLVEFQRAGDKLPEAAAVGDFYMSDGTLVGKDANLTSEQKAACIGIVYWIDKTNQIKEDNYGLLEGKFPDGTHGLVVSLWDMPDPDNAGSVEMAWTYGGYEHVNNWLGNTNGTWDDKPESFTSIQETSKMQGYANTIALEEYNKHVEGGSGDGYGPNSNKRVKPVKGLAAFQEAHPAPSNSSGWYWPSVCELKYVCWGQDKGGGTDGKEMLNEQIEKVGNGNTFGSAFYWSSTEGSYDSNAWCVYFYNSSNNVNYYGSKGSSAYRVRPLLAF